MSLLRLAAQAAARAARTSAAARPVSSLCIAAPTAVAVAPAAVCGRASLVAVARFSSLSRRSTIDFSASAAPHAFVGPIAAPFDSLLYPAEFSLSAHILAAQHNPASTTDGVAIDGPVSTFDTIVREFAAAPTDAEAAAADAADDAELLQLQNSASLSADVDDLSAAETLWTDSVKRKRTRKMNKHKYKKRLKEQRRQSRKNSAQ